MSDVNLVILLFILSNTKNINPVICARDCSGNPFCFFCKKIAAESPALLLLGLFSSMRTCYKQKGGAQIIYNFHHFSPLHLSEISHHNSQIACYLCSMASVYQTNVNTIVSVLHLCGVRHVVISPGSRSAPLVMSFVRHGGFECHSVVDERSAAFIGLGMARELQKPVVILCTSGTAALNYYPAIAEAFYSQIPLFVITADRPPEMLERWDGQTIKQFEVYKNHVLGSFETTDDLDDKASKESIGKLVYEAFRICDGHLKGPVHLNVPLRDPLYRDKNEKFDYPLVTLSEITEDEFEDEIEMAIDTDEFFSNYTKILIINGAGVPDERLNTILKKLSDKKFCVVLSDVISNHQSAQNAVRWDGMLTVIDKDQKELLRPDLVITIGTQNLSKGLKLFLREHTPAEHWHVTDTDNYADQFFVLNRVIEFNPAAFMEQFANVIPDVTSEYYKLFNQFSNSFDVKLQEVVSGSFNEFDAVRSVIKMIPANSVLHLANSMSVRYASYWGISDETVSIHSNRGTSGIDGCTSTALGAALAATDKTVTLITGDIAFFYDINALWQTKIPGNLKIIVLNNFSGSIFRFIDAGDIPELDPYFETSHTRTAQPVAEMFGLQYLEASDEVSLLNGLTELYKSTSAAVLEIKTNKLTNEAVYRNFKQIKI